MYKPLHKDGDRMIQKLAEEFGFELEDAKKLVEVFCDSLEGYITALEEYVESSDFIHIASTAHTIKGSASNMMLDEIVAVAQQIETDAIDQDEAAIAENLQDLKTIADQLIRDNK